MFNYLVIVKPEVVPIMSKNLSQRSKRRRVQEEFYNNL